MIKFLILLIATALIGSGCDHLDHHTDDHSTGKQASTRAEADFN